jgi:hypothetical protein
MRLVRGNRAANVQATGKGLRQQVDREALDIGMRTVVKGGEKACLGIGIAGVSHFLQRRRGVCAIAVVQKPVRQTGDGVGEEGGDSMKQL